MAEGMAKWGVATMGGEGEPARASGTWVKGAWVGRGMGGRGALADKRDQRKAGYALAPTRPLPRVPRILMPLGRHSPGTGAG